jgi:anti-sigma B factor antagonist
VQIAKEQLDGVAILRVEGEIDLYNAPQIKNAVKALVDAGMPRAVINLDKVSYIDSSGIGALISSLSSLKKAGGGLRISNTRGAVLKVFQLTKLTSFFELHDTEDTALKSFT